MKLFFETIDPATLSLLRRLQEETSLRDTRLVGGTALALQLGHRKSIDLDLFGKWDYSIDLQRLFGKIGRVEKQSGTADGKMQFYYINDVKVDIVSYEEYEWLDEPVCTDGVRLAGVRDIGAMKINAITNRGTRKDFVDLARLLDEWTLKDVFGWYAAKYPNANPALALRRLSYFVDAEAQPLPRMMIPFDWDAAVAKIIAAVRGFITSSC